MGCQRSHGGGALLLAEKVDVDRLMLSDVCSRVRYPRRQERGLLEESIKIAELLLGAGADINKCSIGQRTIP